MLGTSIFSWRVGEERESKKSFTGITQANTQDTEYLDGHHWTNEVRCVYKNIGYTLRKSRIRWYATGKVQYLPRGETDGIICLQAPVRSANAVLLRQSKIRVPLFAGGKRQDSHKNCVGRPEARSTRTRVDSWTKQAHSCPSLLLLCSPHHCK